MSKDWQSQAHVRWDCKFHVVIVPKYRKKLLYGKVRRKVGEILRDLCRQAEVVLVEGHLMPDHVHMLLSIPPRYSVANVVGFLKGKSAIRMHRDLLRYKGAMFGRAFWTRGYCAVTVGEYDEAAVREYIREQEKLDRDSDQGTLGFE